MDSNIIKLVKEIKRIAVVGCSRHSYKPAYYVPEYMQNEGYTIIPVNPNALGKTILGEGVFQSLRDMPHSVDMINIFRPSDQCLEVLQSIINLETKPKLIWMQLGIQNQKAKVLAEQYNIPLVMNKCLMVEHRKMDNNY